MFNKNNPPDDSKPSYWFHPESDSYWIHNPETDKPLNFDVGDGMSLEITEEKYIDRVIEQIDNDPQHKLPEGVTAVIKGAYQFAAGGMHGSIFYDQNGRFPDNHQVKLSTIISKEPGGIYKTKNSTYLVQMIQPASNNNNNTNSGDNNG